MDPDFENKVKRSFSKVREHMEQLEQQIKQNKAILENIFQRVAQASSEKKIDSEQHKPQITRNDQIDSIGNQGVKSLKQASKQASKHLSNLQIDDINSHFDQKLEYGPPKTTIEPTLREVFVTLTNREFVIFLTIYQLGESTYQDLANKLSLTNSCIRTRVCSLIAKKAPIIRRKINNWKVLLSIDPDFKSIVSEDKLLEMYYRRDSSQTTLH